MSATKRVHALIDGLMSEMSEATALIQSEGFFTAVVPDALVAEVIAAAQPEPVPIRSEFHVITISISAPSLDEGKKLSDQIMEIKRGYSVLLNLLETTPATRERALAVTNLQQSCFWAVDGAIRGQLAAWRQTAPSST